VQAAGGTVDRRLLYRAAGIGYLGNIVNRDLGFNARACEAIGILLRERGSSASCAWAAAARVGD